MLRSSSRLTLTSGIEPHSEADDDDPAALPQRAQAVGEAIAADRIEHHVDAAVGAPASAWSFQAASERSTSSAPASRATRSLASVETTAIVRAPEPLRHLQRRGPDAAGGAVHQHRLALGERPRSLSAKYAVW